MKAQAPPMLVAGPTQLKIKEATYPITGELLSIVDQYNAEKLALEIRFEEERGKLEKQQKETYSNFFQSFEDKLEAFKRSTK